MKILAIDTSSELCSTSILENEVVIDEIIYGRGQGKSKKEAEQNAAKDAYMKSAKKWVNINAT